MFARGVARASAAGGRRGFASGAGSGRTAGRGGVRVAAAAAAAATVTAAAAAAAASEDERQRIARLLRLPATALVAAATGGQPAVALAASVNWDAARKDIAALLESNPSYDDGSYGPLLVRLAWHAAGTYSQFDGSGGSNGAGMRFPPEATDGANAGLDIARKLLEPVKAKHPDASYADLWTLAGVVAIEAMGGPKVPWKPGRTDDKDGSKRPANGRLPDAARAHDHIRAVFYRMGFDDREIVALLGAHSLGRCHTDRSGFKGPWTRAPTAFSNEYFRELLENKWTKKRWNGPEQFEDPTGELMMLPADLALLKDNDFRKFVELYAKNEEVFFKDFAAAFGKLLELGVPRSKGWF